MRRAELILAAGLHYHLAQYITNNGRVNSENLSSREWQNMGIRTSGREMNPPVCVWDSLKGEQLGFKRENKCLPALSLNESLNIATGRDGLVKKKTEMRRG